MAVFPIYGRLPFHMIVMEVSLDHLAAALISYKPALGATIRGAPKIIMYIRGMYSVLAEFALRAGVI